MEKKIYRKTFLFLLSVFCVYAAARSQTDDMVTGTVSDNIGTPLPGATILVKGTSNGTQSDFDGNYSIRVGSGQILVFSYIGYQTQEILMSGQTSLNIVLLEDANVLDEVILVGYGTQSRIAVTNAISSVAQEDLVETPAINVQQALQGRAAGVQVTNTGTPGSNPLVSIRGIGTFGNSTPLFVVDGVPTGNLNAIPVESIESVDVLKDASSAAIFGSRGSNGVILIKTKGGRKGKPTFEFSSYTGLANFVNKIDVLNADQYRQYASEAYDADPVAPGNQIYPGLQPGNFNPAVNTNWQDEVIRTGLIQNFDVQAAGGSENANYSLRLGYLKQEGTIIENQFERYSVGLNTSMDITSKFKVGQTLNLAFNESAGGQAGSFVLVNAVRFDPTRPVFDESTNFFSEITTAFNGQDAENPVRIMRNGTSGNQSTGIIGSVFANYEIIEGLTFNFTFGIDHSLNNFNGFTKSIPTGSRANINAITEKNRSRFMGTVITNTLNYKKTFGKNNFDLLAGYERNKGTFDQVNARTQNDLTDFVENLINGPSNVLNLSSNSSENLLHSTFGRLNYDYDNIVLLSATVRRDGSSRFGPNNKWGTFPSFSGGINLGKLGFMVNNETISLLKIRGSWGLTGNNNIGDYLFDFGLQTDFNYVIDGNLVSGTRPSRLANPNLKWEELESTNLGLDLGFFNNALTLSAEYFSNKSNGLLVDIPTPRSSGDTRGFLTQNVGGTETSGLEFNLGYNNNQGKLQWGVNANFTKLKAEVTSLGGVEAIFNGVSFQQNHNRLVVGEAPFHFFGFKTQGIFQNDAEVAAAPTQNNAQPGNIRFQDTNNDNVIDADDRVIIGNPTPDFTANLDFNLRYKNLDLSLFLNGVYGNEIYNAYRYNLEQQSRLFNMSTKVLYRWSPTNPSNTIPKATPGFTGNEVVSDRFIEDGSYTRLRSATLGFSVPQRALESFSKAGVNKVRLYISGQNLFTWTKYTGYDPEIVPLLNGGTINAIGLDVGSYPQPRTFLAGVQVQF